ncbi:proline dehydrogenase 1, mitochondrial-like isoform X2 [Watersipora subatra]
MNFMDSSRTAFRKKSFGELLRALTVLSLCSSNSLVTHNQQLMTTFRKILGRSLYERFMQLTFYGQFVIGKEEKTVRPIIERYLKDGVGPILYYALEEDKSETNRLSNDPFYARNVASFKEAIDITARAAKTNGYIAVKPTALCSPYLWVKLTEVIQQRTQQVESDSYHRHTEFLCGSQPEGLTKVEVQELNKLGQRAEDIITHAAHSGVRVMIDAEQTYMQPAIQRVLGVEMMNKFNKKSVVVFVTYQTYLKGALQNIARDLQYCQRENIKFGGRIVRGAYLNQERNLAEEHGYEDPTNPSFSATSQMYHNVVQLLLQRIEDSPGDTEVMFATHNEDTLRFILSLLELKSYSTNNISFGQLYGMCEHITFHLGQVGIPVYKSMPYGEIDLVTSYLGRRVIENKGVFEKVKKEKKLLSKELARRVWKKN